MLFSWRANQKLTGRGRIKRCKQGLKEKRAAMVKQERHFTKYEASVREEPDAAELLKSMRGVLTLGMSGLRKRCEDLEFELGRYTKLLKSLCPQVVYKRSLRG